MEDAAAFKGHIVGMGIYALQSLEFYVGQAGAIKPLVYIQQLGLAGVPGDKNGGQGDQIGELTGDVGGELLGRAGVEGYSTGPLPVSARKTTSIPST